MDVRDQPAAPEVPVHRAGRGLEPARAAALSGRPERRVLVRESDDAERLCRVPLQRAGAVAVLRESRLRVYRCDRAGGLAAEAGAGLAVLAPARPLDRRVGGVRLLVRRGRAGARTGEGSLDGARPGGAAGGRAVGDDGARRRTVLRHALHVLSRRPPAGADRADGGGLLRPYSVHAPLVRSGVGAGAAAGLASADVSRGAVPETDSRRRVARADRLERGIRGGGGVDGPRHRVGTLGAPAVLLLSVRGRTCTPGSSISRTSASASGAPPSKRAA